MLCIKVNFFRSNKLTTAFSVLRTYALVRPHRHVSIMVIVFCAIWIGIQIVSDLKMLLSFCHRFSLERAYTHLSVVIT